MNNLKIINYEGINVTDSRQVAEMVDIRHDNLLGKIRGYVDIMDSSKLSSQHFFIKSVYLNSQSKQQPCYLLTKQGCEMVANKLTGKKGVLFTAKYVQAFNKMQSQPKILTPQQELKLHYEVLENHEKELEDIKEDVKGLKNNLPLFNIECDELQKLVKKIGTKELGGHGSIAYSNKSIRTKVYADLQHQLKREFGVSSYKAIKRCQLSTAENIISSYKVPIVLENEIDLLNNQIRIEEEI